MSYEIKTKWFDCQCHCPECSVRFIYGEYSDGKEMEKDDADLTLEFQPTIWQPWYKRLVNAVKYLFKQRPSKYSWWTETVLSYDNIVELRDFLNTLLERPVKK